MRLFTSAVFTLLATAAGLGSLSACGGADADAETTESSTDPTTGSSTDGSDAGAGSEADESPGSSSEGPEPRACDPGQWCAPPVPISWNGPVARHASDEAFGACGGRFPELVSELVATMAAEPAQCECDCIPGEAFCPTTATLQNFATTSSCLTSSPLDSTTLSPGACAQDANGAGGSTWRVAPLQYSVPPCEVQFNESILEPVFSELTTLCAAPGVGAACAGDGTCIPEVLPPFSGELCIWSEGTRECPADYPVPHALFADIEDTRACSECQCGDPQGQCEGGITVALSSDCSGLASGTIPFDGECHVVTLPTSSAIMATAPTPSPPTCEQTGGTTIGNSGLSRPHTVCCQG